jgi:antitoxin MazE
MKAYEDLYQYHSRKAFKIGGSLAVRIPKQLAEVAGIKEGTRVKFAIKDKKLVIEAVS